MASYRFGSVQVTRGQLVLLLGTPIVIGLGYYAYRKAAASRGVGGDAARKKGPKAIEPNKKVSSLSLDGTNEDNDIAKSQKNAELNGDQLSPLKEATLYKTEGNNCYRNGKFDEAIKFYDKAIERCPAECKSDLAIFYQNRAAAYEMLKKWNAVKEDCSRSIASNPRYAKAYFRRAKAYEATNDYTDCLNDITATCILEMFQHNATILYADRILKITGRMDAENAISEKRSVLPSASFIETYLRSFVADPLQQMQLPMTVYSEPARGFVRAKLALDQERYDDIIPACTEEIEASEAEAQYKMEALLLRGTFYLLSGNFDESKRDFDAVINNATADPKLRAYAYLKRASLHIQKEEKEQGLSDFERAQQLQPDSPDVYHQRAQIYIMLDQLPLALEEFEKAVKMSPDNAMAYVQKCYAEYRLSLFSQDQMRLLMVMNEFKNAIEKFPNCVDCYSLMAQVLCDQQQFQQADHFYERALKIAPKNAALYVHRGIMLLQWKGDVENAIKLLNRAIDVDDKCLLAYETLGTIEVQRANLTNAIEYFEKAIALAKGISELSHLYSLRNAAIAQIDVTRKLGIDISTIAALAQSGVLPANGMGTPAGDNVAGETTASISTNN